MKKNTAASNGCLQAAPARVRVSEPARHVPQSFARLAICRLLLGAGSVLLSQAAVAGGTDDIVTDRPDFVESSNVVGKGRVQVEASVAFERNDADGNRDRISTTPTLIRVGVTDTVELRVETDGRTVARSANGSVRGMSDLAIGAKWHLADANGNSPSLALLAHVDLASGSAAFRGDGRRPSLRVAAEWELPNEMSLGLMPGVIVDKDTEGRRFTAGIFGVVVGKSWTDKFRTFAEVSMPQIAGTSHGGVQTAIDIGAAYLISNQVQIDTAVARGLNNNTADLGWTFGLSVKF